MTTRQATVINEYGIHCRPSAIILKEMYGFPDTTFTLDAGQGETTIGGVMDLLSMDMSRGTQVTLRAHGGDEDRAADRLAALLSTNFDFRR